MWKVMMALVVVVSLGIMGPEFASAHKVELLDDCDPRDPAWAPTGGCTLKKGTSP